MGFQQKQLLYPLGLVVICASGLHLWSPFLCGADTTVLVVRHAEKQLSGLQNLTAEGQRRAQDLLETVRDAGVAAVFATEFCRTAQTAQPLAASLGQSLVIKPTTPGAVVDFSLCDPPVTLSVEILATARDYETELADLIRRDYEGQTVVVVGHSNTSVRLIQVLGVPSPCPDYFPALDEDCTIPESEYDHMFVVTVPPRSGEPGIVRARYGSPSPPSPPTEN